jgi:hypothetical protein
MTTIQRLVVTYEMTDEGQFFVNVPELGNDFDYGFVTVDVSTGQKQVLHLLEKLGYDAVNTQIEHRVL